MAKNDVKQLNYTFDEINKGLESALKVDGIELQYSEDNNLVQLVSGTEDARQVLGSIKNPGAETGGLTLKYIDEKTLRIYNTNGSTDENDWTPVGNEVVIISADPDAISYRFDFTPVSATEPQVFVKESVDANVQDSKWQIQYQIKQLDNKGNISYDPIEVVWKVTSGNNSREFKETIKYGVDTLDAVYSFNWVDKIYKDVNFYKAGSYNVSATFYGVDGLKITRRWDFSLTSLTFKTTFDETLVYQDSEITIPFEVNGNMQKTVKGYIINKQTKEETLINSINFVAHTFAQTGEFRVSNLVHGTYAIRLECAGLSGKTTVSAPSIYKEFIFVEKGNDTPLIRWSYPEENPLQQYTRTAFKYSVYNPVNALTDITIELYSENNNTKQTRTVTPNNTTYTWYYYPTADSSQNGVLRTQEFSIKTIDLDKNISATKQIIVNPFDGADKIVQIDGAAFDFNPLGRTNYDLNRNEYIYKDKNRLEVSENFDWANGGWVQENIGTNEKPQIVDAFLIKAGSSITLDYNLFEYDIRNTGKNMKFIFKTTNCQKMTAPVMVCKGNNNTGLIINSQNAEIFYRQDAEKPVINLPYVEEEIVELEYNIEAENIKDSQGNDVPRGRKPLLVTYLSSDPSQAVTCEPTPQDKLLGEGQWTQDTPQKLIFGSDYCDIYLYRVKVYEKELSDKEIMQNYYADAFDGATAYQRYNDNNILDENDEINIDLLKEKYPELRILMIDCKDVWSNGKKDFREAYVEHYYPNGRLKDNWKANVGIAIQGTSSVEYLTSAGNFDMDISFSVMGNTSKDEHIVPTREIGMKYLYNGLFLTKEELAVESGANQEEVAELLETEYAMTDSSLPVSYINVKVNVASSENANNARLAEWFHKYNAYKRKARQFNDKIRDTMEFHPCVIFIRENAGLDNREFNNDGNYHFYACGDFGNSKKNNNAFGMGEEAKYIVNDLIANGDLDESQRDDAIKEYQGKECIVEVSNNIHDICRFKTAIFEDYQVSFDDKKQKVAVSDLWDGDAVEFRYKKDKSAAKKETLRLWRWLYSVDAARPGYNELLVSDVECIKDENNAIYSFDTIIPHNDDFTIIDIAPNFLLNITSEGSIQTFSKYNIQKFITNYLKDEVGNHILYSINGEGNYRITITLPLENLIYAENKGWTPKFFINFTSKYVLNWNFEENTFTISDVEDTEEYRNNKFKTEYTKYFESDSVLFHYLFTERFTMIDNRAKNTFIHTADGLIWDYCFNYDDDTALGCNNRGYLTMDYGVEDIDNEDGYPVDTYGGAPAFNANDSVLWVNIRNNLNTELKQVYNKASLTWSSASMNSDFETYQGYKCNWLQMIDMRRKYLRPFTYGHGPDTKTKVSEEKYLPMLQGRKTLQRRRYQKYQEIYFESKYTQTTTHNQFTFRAAFSEIQPSIIPYIKCYPIIDWDDTPPSSQRTWPGQPYNTPSRTIENDLNFTIYPAQHISAVNGLNNAGVKSASMGNGIKLTDINLSDNTELPSGNNAKLELSGNQTLLTSLNLKNTGATVVPSLSELTNIQYLNTEDTRVSSITFANGGLIREAKLGSITNELSCINNSNLELLTIQKNENNEYNLKTITINNPSKLMNWIDLLDLSVCPKLEKVTILNVDYKDNNCWSFENNTWIEELYKLSFKTNEDGKPYSITLTGNIYIDQIREHDYNKYLEKWPGLTIGHAAAFMPTYKVSYYKDSSKQELLLEEIYDKDAKTVKPSIIPVKEPDYQYTYEFLHWTADGLDGNEFIFGTALNKDTEIYAVYTSKERKFRITWYKDSTKTEILYGPKEYSYGEKAVYEGPELEPQPQTSGFSEYYNLFEQWSDSTTFIEEDLDVYAKWMNGSVDNITDTKELNAAQLYTLIQTGKHVDYFSDDEGETSTFERIRIPLGSQLNYNNLNKYKVAIKDEKNEDIQFPLIFKGTQTEGIKTNINLFEGEDGVNSDWTLFLDLQYMNDVAGTSLASCFNGRFGFQVKNTKNYPYIHYNTDEPTIGGSNTTNANTNTGALREVFVITHKGGHYDAAGEYQRPVLTVYSGMLNQLKPYKKILVEPLTPNDVHSQPLVFGAQLKGATWVKSSIATGIIYGCEMWNKVLSDEDCMELVSWPREQAEFTAVSFGNLYDKEGNETNINLIAAQTTIAKVSYYTSSNMNPTSFVDSNMQQWLDTRYWNAIPAVWRYLIKTPQITYTTKSSTQTLIDSKLYIPSVYELLASTSPETIYINEGRVIPLLGLRTDEGRLDRASGWEYNTRFTPGNPMVDIYPNTNGALKPDWVYPKEGQYEQPTENVLNGSIWLSGTQYQLYHHGFWVNWGEGALPLRSITSSSAFKALQYSGQNSYLGTPSVSTDSYYHPLPCFSI